LLLQLLLLLLLAATSRLLIKWKYLLYCTTRSGAKSLVIVGALARSSLSRSLLRSQTPRCHPLLRCAASLSPSPRGPS